MEVVKIFDHLSFFLIIKLENVSFRELFRIVADGLVDFLGCYTIQFGDIAIEDYLPVAQGGSAIFVLPDFCRENLISEFFAVRVQGCEYGGFAAHKMSGGR